MPMDVDETQTKLATWAQDPSFRFNDIYNLMCYPGWLDRAYRSVKSNSGSGTAGVDGQTLQDFEEDLDENLNTLSKELKAESYDPKPVRRTYIPKGDGRKRPLGIPTIKDRIVQEALRMLLEPIYEQDFSDYSFGFRPNRRTHDAIKTARLAARNKKCWILDADIKGFFDNVDHQTLEQIIQDRITQKKVRELVWSFLKAGVMEDGTVRHSMLGTPQGGIVSPLLANIYLNELDQWVKRWTDLTHVETSRRRKRGKGSWTYVRYADDFLMLSNSTREKAEEMRDRVADFLDEELNLNLSNKKTEMVHLNDGAEFLGYRIQKKGERVLKLMTEEAVEDIREKVRAATTGATNVSVRAKVKALNATLRGWAEYYKYAERSARRFTDVDSFAWDQLANWLGRKYEMSVAQVCKHKLDQNDPLRVNGISLFRTRDKNGNYMESTTNKPNIYLGEEEEERESLPDDNPWLATNEGRNMDKRWKALERDDWTCQECGMELGERQAEVHHIRMYKGYSAPEGADRLENLTSLCKECHKRIHA